MDGWVQIIRGPRPKSEKWPKAGQQKVPRSATSQPFPGDTHSRRDSGSETVPLVTSPALCRGSSKLFAQGGEARTRGQVRSRSQRRVVGVPQEDHKLEVSVTQ